jgi:hypothetical protein
MPKYTRRKEKYHFKNSGSNYNKTKGNGWSYHFQFVVDKGIKYPCLQQVRKWKKLIIRVEK